MFFFLFFSFFDWVINFQEPIYSLFGQRPWRGRCPVEQGANFRTYVRMSPLPPMSWVGGLWGPLGLRWGSLGLKWGSLGLKWGSLGLNWGSLDLNWGSLALN